MEHTRASKFQNFSLDHSQGKLQLVITKSWLQPIGIYNFLVYKLQFNGATTPPILHHPLEGAPTPNQQAETC